MARKPQRFEVKKYQTTLRGYPAWAVDALADVGLFGKNTSEVLAWVVSRWLQENQSSLRGFSAAYEDFKPAETGELIPWSAAGKGKLDR